MLCSTNLKTKGVSHGFFTREGGVSEGIYASLNCGSGSDDNQDHVKENQKRAMALLGDKELPLCRCYQIHSPDVMIAQKPWEELPKADAMVTNTPNLAIGILTADCAPVLFADSDNGVIGAAHAGWKGAIGGVVENTIAKMEELGAKREAIAASVGPCIAQDSYEVGPEFYTQFVEQNALFGTFFKESPKADHFLFDLSGFVMDRLAQSGLQNIDCIGKDTYSEEQQFFSYRRKTHRDEPDYGRQLSAIVLR